MCNPKEIGGLGFRKSKEVNLAFIMKLTWGLVSKPETLWVRVMRSKCGCIEGIVPDIRKRSKVFNAFGGGGGILQVWSHCK